MLTVVQLTREVVLSHVQYMRMHVLCVYVCVCVHSGVVYCLLGPVLCFLQLKEKEELLQQTRGACADLEQKLSKLNTKHSTLSNENAALRAQLKNWEKDMKAFKAIEGVYQKTFEEAKTYKELYNDAESKRAAAASRVNELTMVVNAIEAKGHGNAGENVEALREDYQRLQTQFNVSLIRKL